MKIIRKVLLLLLIAVATVVIALAASAFLFKEKIIKQFIQRANEQLSTPVTIGKIDVSVFQNFPRISIVFHDVYVEDSHPGKYPLLTARQVSFHLQPLDVYRGNYTIQGIRITDSETTLKIDAKGNTNYTITKATGQSGTIRFELNNVLLKNTRVRYVDIQQQEDFVFTSEQVSAGIQSRNNEYFITAKGDLSTEKFMIRDLSLFSGKKFDVSTRLRYDDEEKKLDIQPSDVTIRGSSFNISGSYEWKDKPQINLGMEGRDTDIQTLLSLLPESVSERLAQYQSKGTIYFKARMQGELSDKRSPSFTSEFGFNKATIIHQGTSTKLEEASLEGFFQSSAIRNPAAGVLSLRNIHGKLNGNPFQSNLVIKNFSDADVIFDFKGDLDAAALIEFYPMNDIHQLSGTLAADVAFEGRLSLLKTKATAQKTSTRGTIEVKNLSALFGEANIPLSSLYGSFQFNNNDLALSNVTGALGNSDFKLNGFFKNIITFLLFENQPVGIEADLKSENLNLDELFAYGYGSTKTGSENQYTFSISPNVNLNFNCDVGRLNYKRFKGQQLKGDLLVKNQVAVSRNITLKSMGGDLILTGIVDAKNPKAISVSSYFRLNGLRVDSVFYVFENFYQTFIEDRHLKGSAFADVSMDFVLNQHLKLFPETLIADISATIKNGELNQFTPLKALNKYLDDDGLNNLRFADLKNDIHIENKTVYIPLMEVRSNVTVLQISGTHRFDQQIDYRIVTPLNNKRKIDISEAAGAIEEMEGRSKLFLKITGTTDNYKVQYDTEAVKNKIIADLKREVQELKDLFKNKKKKKEAVLSSEEFDWDNNNH